MERNLAEWKGSPRHVERGPRQMDREPEAYRKGSLNMRNGALEREPWTHGKKRNLAECEGSPRHVDLER